jgi:hypothetical protein
MRGSVWILIDAYLTNRRGTVFAKQEIYGFSEVRQINTIEQQRLQYNKALNKALATYRMNNNLDSDTEVHYYHLNDGITYEGSVNGVKQIKRKKTKLSGIDKRKIHYEVLQTQKLRGEKGKHITQEEKKKMYAKQTTEKQYKKLNKGKIEISNTKEDKRRKYLRQTSRLEEPKGNIKKPPQ